MLDLEQRFNRSMIRAARYEAYVYIYAYVVGRRQKNAPDEKIRKELNVLIDKALENARKDGE